MCVSVRRFAWRQLEVNRARPTSIIYIRWLVAETRRALATSLILCETFVRLLLQGNTSQHVLLSPLCENLRHSYQNWERGCGNIGRIGLSVCVRICL